MRAEIERKRLKRQNARMLGEESATAQRGDIDLGEIDS